MNPAQIRNNNYAEVKDKIPSQDARILSALGLLKKSGASGVYNYLKWTNNGDELYPLTSIRRSLNTMFNNKEIEPAGEVKSEIYDSTETEYRIKEIKLKLF